MTVTATPARNNSARQPEDTGVEAGRSGVHAASAQHAAACLEITGRRF
jgi:hypothetical protein